MDTNFWIQWVEKIRNYSNNEINKEITEIDSDTNMPYVERKLKLGCLYYKKDYIGIAASYFNEIEMKLSDEKNNFQFLRKNQSAINVLQMGYRIQNDGCGGYEIVETGCGSGGCGWLFCLICCGPNIISCGTCCNECGDCCMGRSCEIV